MDFWQHLGNLSSALQVITVIASVYAAIKLWQQNRRLRDLARATPPIEDLRQLINVNEGVKSVAPTALAVSLLDSGESIKSTVEQFLQASQLTMRVEEIKHNGIRTVEDREWFVNELRRTRSLFQQQGVTEIHLFFAGPVQAATIAGSMLDNWIPIKLYQRAPSGNAMFYEYWMPLL
jgi:hypothetical protein